MWSNREAELCASEIRAILTAARAPTGGRDVDRLRRRAEAALTRAGRLLDDDVAGDVSRLEPVGGRCEWCEGPMPDGLRPEARFCGKRCRQAASRARLKDHPRSPSAPATVCGWCGGPMPGGLRAEATFCGKRCRQASSRFGIEMRQVPGAELPGPADTSPSSTPAAATRRRPPRREVLDDASRAMRFCYADPPYPGRASYYPEAEEVDHDALVDRLVAKFGDGWALSTSAAALQQVLAVCPAGVRVCSWHRPVRPTRSRRPISAWEPLIVSGGRELARDHPQQVRDALAHGGRYRAYPGAIVGMKPPQFASWLFAQLGARPGDELVDLYPGSGAVGEAWRRYTGQAPVFLPAAPSSSQCPACFGHSEPCEACVAAAGDPASADFVLGPSLEQIRRCGCGRVYGAYHAGRGLCFVMQPPGRRQVERCVRCGQRLTGTTTAAIRHVEGPAPPASETSLRPPATSDTPRSGAVRTDRGTAPVGRALADRPDERPDPAVAVGSGLPPRAILRRPQEPSGVEAGGVR